MSSTPNEKPNNSKLIVVLGIIIVVFGNGLLIYSAVNGILLISILTFILLSLGLLCVIGDITRDFDKLELPTFITIVAILVGFLYLLFPNLLSAVSFIVTTTVSIVTFARKNSG